MSGTNDPQHQAAAAESATTPIAPKPETPVAEAAAATVGTPEPGTSDTSAPDTQPTATATATAETETEAQTQAEAEAEAAETDASAAGTAKSTASRPFSRPSRGLLAGAAIAGTLLIGVPFLVSGMLNRQDSGNDGASGTVADAGTVLNSSGSGVGPGAYTSAAPEPSSPSPSASEGKEDGGKGNPKARAAVTGAPVAKSTEEPPTKPKPSKRKTPTTPTTVTTAPGAMVYGHASNRCIEMVGHKGADGSPLQIADCTGTNWQKWDFRPDGTIRSMGLCMDVAWGSHDNGAVIQIAWCSGNPAQQFVLNASNDLVNPQADKCVDVKDARTGGGARLQLWDCNGQDNQKWSTR
ncbi:RICIN domain-containing protein [Streptomyces sp. ITFR-16]|uniref:RICIN domain-containing protein n=1 Tax=Streptomyces sp. ITFR-16 TaxID=3075198 RepID=UPI00288982EE|nr:RICIN domain-containing protein [Streptomyces sp. ITFR-16]WNI21453.1 RICIN domain-containing protein [Streptomyces sp. ITFR-16]